jgi:hypothetical protein
MKHQASSNYSADAANEYFKEVQFSDLDIDPVNRASSVIGKLDEVYGIEYGCAQVNRAQKKPTAKHSLRKLRQIKSRFPAPNQAQINKTARDDTRGQNCFQINRQDGVNVHLVQNWFL